MAGGDARGGREEGNVATHAGEGSYVCEVRRLMLQQHAFGWCYISFVERNSTVRARCAVVAG